MKRSGSSSESLEETVGVTVEVVGGAEEVGGAEDMAVSMTTLVESVRGADKTRRVFAEEG